MAESSDDGSHQNVSPSVSRKGGEEDPRAYVNVLLSDSGRTCWATIAINNTQFKSEWDLPIYSYRDKQGDLRFRLYRLCFSRDAALKSIQGSDCIELYSLVNIKTLYKVVSAVVSRDTQTSIELHKAGSRRFKFYGLIPFPELKRHMLEAAEADIEELTEVEEKKYPQSVADYAAKMQSRYIKNASI